MADPVTSPSGSGPSTLILENQSRTVSSHTDVRVHEEINQLHGTHHKLDFAEESGGAVMLEKPVLQHASDETRSLQNYQMEDKDRDSEPDRNNMSPAGKEMMLQFDNQHEETATAGKQVTLPAHQQDPKVPPRSKISKFHGVSFNSVSNLWKVFVWDPTKKPRDPRKNGGQWYLGTYDSQEKAAQIHDKAIIKLGRHKGPEGTRTCPLNFPLSTYASDIEEMERGCESTKEYFRRLRASYAWGYMQGQVDMRGVCRKGKSKKYVANLYYKDSATKRDLHIYLGSFGDKVEAGKCYDKAALFYKREAAHTNFPPDSYSKDEIEAYGHMLEAKRQKTN